MGIGNLKYRKKDIVGFDPDKFIEAYNATYDAEKREGFTQKKTFAPSTVGYGHGKCARYWYLAFTGVDFEDTADPKAKGNMENGTFVHTRVQERMSKISGNYQVIKHETEMISSSPPIRGFRDSLILDVENNIEIPFEIKSIKDEKFSVKKEFLTPEENHLIQLLIYMKISGHKVGAFLYENKNDQDMIVIKIEMNEENEKLIDYVLDWLRGVYSLYENKTLPNRAFTKTQSACKYCPIKKACWKDMKNEDGEVEYPPMETKL